MPLYNDAKFLPEVIESVLNQTFTDFEFIIVDNCSTDGSYEIAKKYAENDARIKVYRNRINVGAFNNFRILQRMPKAEFFCQKSSDDIIAPTYFKELIELLKANPDAELVYSNADNVPGTLYSYDSENPLERAKKMAETFCYGHVGYGIYRSSIWNEIQSPMKLQHNDHILFMDLCLHGKVLYLDKVLYYRNVPEIRVRESFAALCGAKEGGDYPDIGWLEMLIGHIRIVQNSTIVKDKKVFCCEIAEIIYKRFGNAIIKEYLLLAKSLKTLRRIKDDNKQWKVLERDNLLREAKIAVEYIPHFHKYLFKETSKLWKLFRKIKRKISFWG